MSLSRIFAERSKYSKDPSVDSAEVWRRQGNGRESVPRLRDQIRRWRVDVPKVGLPTTWPGGVDDQGKMMRLRVPMIGPT